VLSNARFVRENHEVTEMLAEELDEELGELSSAEDFLEFFAVDFDPAVVHVNRLHILQRFHDYLADANELPQEYATRYTCYAGLLSSTYSDFVKSDARTERVFRVFHLHEPQEVLIPVKSILGQVRDAG
jgi:nitrogenase-stabilizing/protective protein